MRKRIERQRELAHRPQSAQNQVMVSMILDGLAL